MADRFALLVAARAACDDVPHAAAEIGSSEDRVQGDSQERDERDQRFGAHAAGCVRGAAALDGSGAGAYGMRVSNKTSVAARNTYKNEKP